MNILKKLQLATTTHITNLTTLQVLENVSDNTKRRVVL
jgi:hypothetical protein